MIYLRRSALKPNLPEPDFSSRLASKQSRYFARLALFLTIFCLFGFSIAFAEVAASTVSTPEVKPIKKILNGGRLTILKRGRFTFYQADLNKFYESREFERAWIRDSTLTKAAESAIAVIDKAKDQGLDPADYEVDALKPLVASLEKLEDDKKNILDVGISLAFLRFISDCHLGRIDPTKLGLKLKVTPRDLDWVDLLKRASEGGDIKGVIRSAEPPIAEYHRLKKALRIYREKAKNETWNDLAPPRTVKEGLVYGKSDLLAANLKVLGDLDSAVEVLPNAIYQGELLEAVKRFQARHGLEVDGVIGPATFAALREPPSYRARQLEFAMERLRWIPNLDGPKSILVNIPVYRLWAFEKVEGKNQRKLEMKVVVGSAVNHQTPVFQGTMTAVEFHPVWNITASIAQKEIFPDWRKDPAYLEKNNREIVNLQGKVVFLSREEAMRGIIRKTLIMRERPGPKNPLGNIKFIFPNEDSIYFHDTPEGDLFVRYRRDFSHGCVRLEKPVDLARFVFSDDPNWSAEAIDAAIKNPQRKWVNLKTPVQVLLFYSTAGTDDQGSVYFSPDIYGHDKKLDEALRTKIFYRT